MKNTNLKVVRLATMALLTAAIFVLQFVTVPLGAITVSLSMVPVSIAAITMGPVYGLLGGAIWGLASIMKALLGEQGACQSAGAHKSLYYTRKPPYRTA